MERSTNELVFRNSLFPFYSQSLSSFNTGLDLVYVVSCARNDVRTFGGTGKLPGFFNDPAGIAVDRRGYMIVADSRNHRLQVNRN